MVTYAPHNYLKYKAKNLKSNIEMNLFFNMVETSMHYDSFNSTKSYERTEVYLVNNDKMS